MLNKKAWSRRRILAFSGALAVLTKTAIGGLLRESEGKPRIGLALGSGGARGLFHLQVFEVFDLLNLRPHCIAGSSIGAVMGALYAAGLSADAIHAALDRVTKARDESWFEALWSRELTRWLRFIEPGSIRGGVARSNAFIEFLRETTGHITRFEDLVIPLKVVATDFWNRDMVVYDQGELWAAVQASMAVPGLFQPVIRDGKVLVDGGLTNPVPFDLLEGCDLVVAVDVLGTRTPNGNDLHPSSLDSIFNTFQIMQSSILHEKLQRQRPDILLQPEIRDIRVLDFYRFEEIFAQGESARDEFAAELLALIQS